MAQMNVWNPTRSLAWNLAQRLTEKAGRSVKQNELLHNALLAYAREQGMSDADIDTACKEQVPTRRSGR